MEKDKSSTHVRVIKNGIEDWFPKTVWESIGGNDNKDGWILVHDGASLPEVVEVRSKKTTLSEKAQAEPVAEAVESEVASAGEPIKVKRAYNKKK